jgi:acetoin utilization protein AcuB
MDITRHMSKNPRTTSPDTSIAEAGKILHDNNFRHLPVVDDKGCLLGMVTDRDLRSALPSSVAYADKQSPIDTTVAQTAVREIMSQEIVSLNTFSTIDDALILFDNKKVGALPVVDDDGRVIGIFSTRDLIISYRNLFGLGEKGSALVAVRNDGQPRPLSRIVHIMEGHDIHFSRIVQKRDQDEQNSVIYIRVNTFNLHAVHGALREAGFDIL